jgi:hypothetical protein
VLDRRENGLLRDRNKVEFPVRLEHGLVDLVELGAGLALSCKVGEPLIEFGPCLPDERLLGVAADPLGDGDVKHVASFLANFLTEGGQTCATDARILVGIEAELFGVADEDRRASATHPSNVDAAGARSISSSGWKASGTLGAPPQLSGRVPPIAHQRISMPFMS